MNPRTRRRERDGSRTVDAHNSADLDARPAMRRSTRATRRRRVCFPNDHVGAVTRRRGRIRIVKVRIPAHLARLGALAAEAGSLGSGTFMS